MKKIYKTNRGREVDIEALRQQNAHTVAVGNLSVNAQGDTVDSNGTVIERLADRVRASGVSSQARVGSIKPPITDEQVDKPSAETAAEPKTKSKARSKAAPKETIDSEGNITLENSPEEQP